MRGKYAGRYSARRGELRIVYASNDLTQTVEVSDVDYRRDVYH